MRSEKGIQKAVFYYIMLTLFIVSCKKNAVYADLESLPSDPGGEQSSFYLGETDAPYGFYLYIPGGYEQSVTGYPLLIFLHGSGERGNSETDSVELENVLRYGPPKLISQHKWNPRYPMIVASPQCHDKRWNPQKIHDFIGYLLENYTINKSRIYLSGLSMGGFGTFSYLQTYADTGYVAAAITVCGGGDTTLANRLVNVPLWAFHGDSDKRVLPIRSIEMVEAINKLNPPVRAKLTIYPGIGHDSWSMTYDGSGMRKESPDYDPYDMNIYDWLFQYTR